MRDICMMINLNDEYLDDEILDEIHLDDELWMINHLNTLS